LLTILLSQAAEAEGEHLRLIMVVRVAAVQAVTAPQAVLFQQSAQPTPLL
jgi:uncharacterized membrane protein